MHSGDEGHFWVLCTERKLRREIINESRFKCGNLLCWCCMAAKYMYDKK